MDIGGTEFDIGARTYIMAILNVTPDSFSDGGVADSLEKAVNRARQMVREGADLIDIGGESTRPGYTPVSAEEELARVLPVIRALRGIGVPLSIDTYKAAVAEAALAAGAALVNDIWGFKKDPGIAVVCAKSGAACCLMHNRADDGAGYSDFFDDVQADLRQSAAIALAAGVKPDRIILDPGIGFAKTYEQNLLVLRHLERFITMGYPLLLGASKKRVVGEALNLPVGERLEGTVATSVIGAMKGCAFIRVHDVLANKRACMMTDRVMKGALTDGLTGVSPGSSSRGKNC